MKKQKRPIIKYVDSHDFLRCQFIEIWRNRTICPNCGNITLITKPKIEDFESKENLEKVFKRDQFQMFLGLCSEVCAREFLGGIYDVYK